MVTRAQVIEQARTWVGTRWHHQGRVKGAGVDCAGLVIEVARELGLAEVNWTDYSRHPDGASLVAACEAHMGRIDPTEALPGDVLVFAFARDPQHLAFLSELAGRPTLLHAFADARKVVEHEYDDTWRARLRGAFRIPGVA